MKPCAPFKSVEARNAYAAAYNATLRTSTVPVEASDIATPYGTAHVLTAGDPENPPLIALHGRCASSTMWMAHLPALVEQRRVVMIDLVGDLNMSVPTKPLARRHDIVAFIDSLLDALAIQRAAFVGMSYGAFASTIYAMQRPNRATRVALLSPAATFSHVSPAMGLARDARSDVPPVSTEDRCIRTINDRADIVPASHRLTQP